MSDKEQEAMTTQMAVGLVLAIAFFTVFSLVVIL